MVLVTRVTGRTGNHLCFILHLSPRPLPTSEAQPSRLLFKHRQERYTNTLPIVEQFKNKLSSVADPDPGSGVRAFLIPGSGIGFFSDLGSRSQIPILDPGSRIPNLGSWIRDLESRISDPGSQTHIFESLVTIRNRGSRSVHWMMDADPGLVVRHC
jgi:hypothetical protein